MKKQAVTLESLDKKIDSKIDLLDKKIDTIDSKLELKIDTLDKKIDEFIEFLKENIMLREETEQRIDDRINTKFTKYTSDQFDFQDHVGKRCENNEHENLAIRYDIDDVKKRLIFVEKHVGI